MQSTHNSREGGEGNGGERRGGEERGAEQREGEGRKGMTKGSGGEGREQGGEGEEGREGKCVMMLRRREGENHGVPQLHTAPVQLPLHILHCTSLPEQSSVLLLFPFHQLIHPTAEERSPCRYVEV